MNDQREAAAELLAHYHRDRRLAHSEIFAHRHKNETAEFHGRIIDRIHGPTPNSCIISFRGSAKSTYAEEALCLKVGFREFHTGLILGASLPLAIQRLHAIRREIEKNRKLKALFGDLRGQPWTDDKLEFSNGLSITAMGKGQALRGSKDEIFRPDFVLADDIEDRESVRTAEGRDKIQSWFMGEVIPAMDPEGRVVVLANILDPECLAEKLKHPDSGFAVDSYPCEYIDARGQRQATWPDRFPLPAIDAKKKSMFALGRAREFMMEYECQAISDRAKTFVSDMKRVEPRTRLWEAVNIMCDPARTVGEESATTAFAAWSWIGPRLYVWELSVAKLMPSEIVKRLFELNDAYRPVKLGFEQDGLNEWALQPIRAEQVRRGITIPLVPVKAPVGKLDFIRALQIYFNAREVWFTQDFHEAWGQFLGFPTGNIDAPNALAYALHPKMKPGIAIYEEFNVNNVSDDLDINRSRASWLSLNATASSATGILAQFYEDRLLVLADWVREGDPRETVAGLLREANLEAGTRCRLVAPPLHFDTYNNVGLVQALARLNAECQSGSLPGDGRDELRSMLSRVSRNLPALLVSSRARWTLNGFAGGYCRIVKKGGELGDTAEEGVYRTLLEGLESFAGLMRLEATDDDGGRNYAVTARGQRYISAQPRR